MNTQSAKPVLSKGFSLAQSVGVLEPAAPNSPEAVTTNTNIFNYQGVLRKPDGTLASGTYSMKFRLYDTVAGGTAKFTDTISSVAVRDGIFDVLLGDVTTNTIGNDVIALPTLFLGIQVSNDTEMQPRQRIHSVPRALTLVPNAYINGGINLWGTDQNGAPTHDPALIEMWPGVPGGSPHAIGTEPYYNRYGPAGNSSAIIGHKFYVRPNEVAAEIGRGNAAGEDALTSTFLGYTIFNKNVSVAGDIQSGGTIVTAPGGAINTSNYRLNGDFPIKILRLQNLGDVFDTPIGMGAEWQCVPTGWAVTADINEGAGRTNHYLYTYLVGNDWRLKGDVVSEGAPDNWNVDVLCINEGMAQWNGASREGQLFPP